MPKINIKRHIVPKRPKRTLTVEEKTELAKHIRQGGYKKFHALLSQIVSTSNEDIDFDTVFASNPNDKTLLFYALLNNYDNASELLMGLGADPFWMSASDVCPLQKFCEYSGVLSQQIIEYVIRKYSEQELPQSVIITIIKRLRLERNAANKLGLEKLLSKFAPQYCSTPVDANKRQKVETNAATTSTTALPSLAQPGPYITARSAAILIPTSDLLAFFKSKSRELDFLIKFREECVIKHADVKLLRETQDPCERLRIVDSILKFKQDVKELSRALKFWHKSILDAVAESNNLTNNIILLDVGCAILKLDNELIKGISPLTVDFTPLFTAQLTLHQTHNFGSMPLMHPSSSSAQQAPRYTLPFAK